MAPGQEQWARRLWSRGLLQARAIIRLRVAAGMTVLLWLTLTGCSTGLAPAEYQAELTATSNAVGSALDQVAKAYSPETLTAELGEAQTAATAAADHLAQLAPPGEVSDLHTDVIAGLRQLATDLSLLASEVTAQQLCAAPSVMASISSQPSVERLRGTAAAFASGTNSERYSWGEFLPQLVPPPDRRLPSGHLLIDHRGSGENKLEVDNGAERDAVVALAQGGRAVLTVYVGGKQKATVDRISDGTYDLYYTLGTDWDEQLQVFTRTCEFARLDQPRALTTQRFRDRIEYTIWQIGLEPSSGGNTTVTPIDSKDFPKG
jgi:hypothetical protein